MRRAAEYGAGAVIATQPGEWRLIEALDSLPLEVRQLPDDRFLCPGADFAAWAEGRKTLRMEFFYREMRRRTGLLMEEDGTTPVGGRWNFDAENRKPPPGGLLAAPPAAHAPGAQVREVLALVEERFADGFGDLHPFVMATSRAEAEASRDHFLARHLPLFGDYQDAMVQGDPFVHHSVLSPYINAGLLDPLDLCRRVEAEWRAGRAPLNAAEGFIRQIIGWREFLRGVYFLAGPDYAARNALGARRALPWFYWSGETDMNCISQVVAETRAHAYAHHIQRLMITGNFALIAGIDPAPVHEWYLAVYADAYEWVEAPNTGGMALFADGGMIASKPYAASANYIDRMSDYCAGCRYGPKIREGEGACPFNLLYWHFLDTHRERFESNPRMAQIYRGWDRREGETRGRILAQAEAFLARMEAGERV